MQRTIVIEPNQLAIWTEVNTGLNPIEQIAPNWASTLGSPALELSTFGCPSTHNNTLQDLQRTSLGPAPPKAGPDSCIPNITRTLTTMINQSFVNFRSDGELIWFYYYGPLHYEESICLSSDTFLWNWKECSYINGTIALLMLWWSTKNKQNVLLWHHSIPAYTYMGHSFIIGRGSV
jgi:hypothetical protein